MCSLGRELTERLAGLQGHGAPSLRLLSIYTHFWDCSSNIFQGFTGSASLSVNLGRCCMRGRETASGRMGKSALRVLAPKQKVSLKVSLVEREGPGWTVSLDSQGDADCPICGTRSSSRHGSYTRSLQDLPAKGTPVLIQARVTRWRCANDECERRTFAGRRPDLTAPFARRATRMAGIVRLFGHAAGGRPSERLLALLGMPVGHTTILRHVNAAPGAGRRPSAWPGSMIGPGRKARPTGR